MSWAREYNSRREFDADSGEGFPDDGKGAAFKEQFEAAKAAVTSILDSGAVGEGVEKDFSITISGYAQPNHEPVETEPSDSVVIAIRQRLLSEAEQAAFAGERRGTRKATKQKAVAGELSEDSPTA